MHRKMSRSQASPKKLILVALCFKKHTYSMKHKSIHCGEAIRTVDYTPFLLANCATEIMKGTAKCLKGYIRNQ